MITFSQENSERCTSRKNSVKREQRHVTKSFANLSDEAIALIVIVYSHKAFLNAETSAVYLET